MSFNKSEALRNAERCIYEGQPSEAITIYRQLLEADPFDLNTISALSNLYVKTGRIQDAIDDFSRIADSYLDKGSPIKSAYILKKILELDPSNARAHVRLGEIYLHEGMSEKAYEAFLTAGVVFKKQGDVVESLKANEKALAIKPDSQQATAVIAALQNSPDSSTTENPPADQKNAPLVGELEPAHAARKPNHGFDDGVVVQQLSMAELLVGYGRVEQAIAMLKEIINHRPDYVDVRVKLKDIYLRSEMMEKASRECFDIARIYEANGDTARARDYTIRAGRLAQLFKDSGSLEREALKKDELTPNTAVEKPETREAASHLESTLPPTPQKSAPAAVSVPATAAQMKLVVEDTALAEQSTFNMQVNDTALVLATKEEREMISMPAISNTTLSILSTRPVVAGTATEKKTRRWLYAAVIAFAILAAIAAVILKGVPMYEARLDKESQSLAQTAPIPVLPQPPDSAPVEENEPNEQIEVRASESASPQPAKPTHTEESQPANTEPPATPQPSPAVVAASEPPKANNPSSPSLPMPASAPNAQGENRAPGGVPDHMPGNASNASEPPPPTAAAARKPGATVRGEPVNRAQPAYPQLAKSTGQSGMVTVEVAINERGDVVSARALSGPSLLRDAAVSAAKRWKFKPSMRDGKPVTSVSTISFNFKL
jgi:protein TonB